MSEDGNVWPSVDFLRLRWLVQDGPISKNIHVLNDVTDSKSAQRPFQTESGELHEIAALPFSDTPVARHTVSVDQMDGLEMWKMWSDGSYSPQRDNSDAAPKLEIKAGEGRDFISIGDYVLAVHPWLLSLRNQYLREVGLINGGQVLPHDTELWFDPGLSTMIQFVYADETSRWEGLADLATSLLAEAS